MSLDVSQSGGDNVVVGGLAGAGMVSEAGKMWAMAGGGAAGLDRGAEGGASGWQPPAKAVQGVDCEGFYAMTRQTAKQWGAGSGLDLAAAMCLDRGGEGVWFGGGTGAAYTFGPAENFAIARTGVKPLLAIDTETGGLEPGKDALLSIAAVLEDGSWCHLRILPPRQWWRLGRRQRVNPGAVKVNGYSEKKWRAAGAVELDVARLRFGLWLSVQCDRLGVTGFQPLAHNAGFDRAFVEAFLAPQKKEGRRGPLDRRWDCSCAALSLARHAGLVACKDASLDSLCAVSGTDREQPHDALSDARACLHGFHWLIRQAAPAAILTSTFPSTTTHTTAP